MTGYDLPRVMTGALGTLGVLTEICLKLWPRPETTATLVFHQLSLARALERMLALAQLPLEISGLAFLPDEGDHQPGTVGRLCVRIEGSETGVSMQAGELRDGLARDARSERVQIENLVADDSAELWRRVRELEFCRADRQQQLWRLCPPPASAVQLVERQVRQRLLELPAAVAQARLEDLHV